MLKQPFKWTDAAVATLVEMWRLAEPASAIATTLGTSRTAVLGKAWRLRGQCPARNDMHGRSLSIKTGQAYSSKNAELKKNQTAISSNQRRKAAKENQDRIAAGLPPISHHKLVTDFSKFAIEGIKPVTFLLVSDRQCKFPVDNAEGADMACCGGEATYGSYCTHHAKISRGQGNRAEQHAVDGMGGRRP